jgi:hypothetical protein
MYAALRLLESQPFSLKNLSEVSALMDYFLHSAAAFTKTLEWQAQHLLRRFQNP